MDFGDVLIMQLSVGVTEDFSGMQVSSCAEMLVAIDTFCARVKIFLRGNLSTLIYFYLLSVLLTACLPKFLIKIIILFQLIPFNPRSTQGRIWAIFYHWFNMGLKSGHS